MAVCEYCGSQIPTTARVCPYCNALNQNMQPNLLTNDPQTIEELRVWYKERNLPPENITRFFIGKDNREPKAFGIYQDGDNFVVYKNTADGVRHEHYRGTNESVAVRELLLKLKEIILKQKLYNAQRRG